MNVRALAVAFALTQSAAAQSVTTLRDVMRIDGATEDITGQGLTTLVLPGNRVAFFDHGRGEFVFFDSTGKRTGTFGRSGEGPGEFGSVQGRNYPLQVGLIGDSIWVTNSRQRRHTIIGPDMKFVRMFLWQPIVPPVTTYRSLAVLDGDRVVARVDYGESRPITLPDGRESRTWTTTESGYAVLAKDGSVERRLATLPPGGATVMISRPNQPIGRTANVPFGHSNLFTESPRSDRVAFVTNTVTGTAGTFTVTVTRTNGEQVYAKSYAYTPEPITSRMRDSALRRSDSSINRGTNPDDNAELIKMVHERMPTTIGPFREVTLGLDGSVWLRKAGPNEGPDEYVVIDATGTQLPNVRMPRKNMRLHTGSRTTVWATETDADGFVSLVRMIPAR
ncbi:MAG TPA: hypothetical protein VJR92_12425 [Gemmatimonadaceae bacterium]|nr:hypothetical protein [Gemmatimonadaceae bacterium]